jgi:hypothetical protein
VPRWWVTDRTRDNFADTDADVGSNVGDVIDIEQLRRDLHLSHVLAWFGFVLILVVAGQPGMGQTTSPSPKRDINAVLAAHDKELIALPGVVGAYIGTLEDNRTLCIKVMLARRDPEVERKIPHAIEGHPVRIEVSGVVRPLRQRP